MQLNEHEKRILTHMKSGYRLVVGRGIYNYVCVLVKDGEDRVRISRQWFVNLRNEGLVAYAGERRDFAVLTKRGASVAEKLQ